VKLARWPFNTARFRALRACAAPLPSGARRAARRVTGQLDSPFRSSPHHAAEWSAVEQKEKDRERANFQRRPQALTSPLPRDRRGRKNRLDAHRFSLGKQRRQRLQHLVRSHSAPRPDSHACDQAAGCKQSVDALNSCIKIRSKATLETASLSLCNRRVSRNGELRPTRNNERGSLGFLHVLPHTLSRESNRPEKRSGERRPRKAE
jgi:hypothetical protein